MIKNGQGTPVKKWCFTLNNPNGGVPGVAQRESEPEENEQAIRVVFAQSPGGYRYLVWQLEEGANGTPHYQGPFHQQCGFVDVMDRLCRVQSPCSSHWCP